MPEQELLSQVTFITSSMGTRWESYSQALLEIHFPECRRILIDGAQTWDPLSFAELGKTVTTKFIVLVDEDCFLFGRDELILLLADMEEDTNLAAIGTPDGGTFHRHLNPIACNTFFLVIRQRALVAATADKLWKELRFHDVEGYATNRRHLSFLDKERIDYGLSEPYYPFFWALLKNRFSINYVIPQLNTELLATALPSENSDRIFLIHMWWLRTWFSKEIVPYLKVCNFERYGKLESRFLAPIFAERTAKYALARHRLARITRTCHRRFKRRIMT